MRILQITPGAGQMYCGNCLRDNALVRSLRKRGHDVLMLPVYLPLTLDEEDQSMGTPVFYGGLNVYFEQLSPAFRKAPRWLLRALSSRRFLKIAAGGAAGTHPSQLGPLTLSMLQGEEGNQARELEQMIDWLKLQPRFDAVVLSNALLIGMGRRLREALRCPVVCQLAGEDSFLDGLPESHRTSCWDTLGQRTREADLLLAPSHYFAGVMSRRLGISLQRIRIVPAGINLDGYPNSEEIGGNSRMNPPVLGFFTRMCADKGLHLLVEAFINLRQRGTAPGLKLQVGGYCGKGDVQFVSGLKQRLRQAGLEEASSFHPNVDRSEKIALLKSMTAFSVPATYGEAFGLYLLEAMAAGVPVVQPNTAAFPELIGGTGGGVLFQPGEPGALEAAVEKVVTNPTQASALSRAGASAVRQRYSSDAMAAALESALAR